MNKAMLALLTDAERLLVAQTEPAHLSALDEDEVSAVHTRIGRARNKYVGIYRRGAAGRVSERGGRGKAGVESGRDRAKAEVFEEALSRVSRRLAVLAAESARTLRDERLASARAARTGGSSGAVAAKPAKTRARVKSPRTPIGQKNRAAAAGKNATWQAKRDSK